MIVIMLMLMLVFVHANDNVLGREVTIFQFRPNATTTQGVIPVGFQGVVDSSGVYNILYRVSHSSLDAPNEYTLEAMIFRTKDFSGGFIPPLQQRVPTESLEVTLRYVRPLSSATSRSLLPHLRRILPEPEGVSIDSSQGEDGDSSRGAKDETGVDPPNRFNATQDDAIPISVVPHVQQAYTLKPISDVLFVAPNILIPAGVESIFVIFTARVLPTNRDLADYRKAIDEGRLT